MHLNIAENEINASFGMNWIRSGFQSIGTKFAEFPFGSRLCDNSIFQA